MKPQGERLALGRSRGERPYPECRRRRSSLSRIFVPRIPDLAHALDATGAVQDRFGAYMTMGSTTQLRSDRFDLIRIKSFATSFM